MRQWTQRIGRQLPGDYDQGRGSQNKGIEAVLPLVVAATGAPGV
jgi:hypothetical protein